MLVPAARTAPRLIGFFAARYLRFTLDNRAAWNAGSAVFQEQSTAGRVYVDQRAFSCPQPSALSAPFEPRSRGAFFLMLMLAPCIKERLRVAKRSSLTATSLRTHGPLPRPGSAYARRLAAVSARARDDRPWPTERNIAALPSLNQAARLPAIPSALQAPRLPTPGAGFSLSSG
jgi:hypothetical protein